MASVPVNLEESKPQSENPTVKTDNEMSEDFEAQFLKDWGFSLRDTYKLTLRFYKGKKISLKTTHRFMLNLKFS